MNFSVNYRKESRWSLKIIAGKVRTKFPPFFYWIIVIGRYVFFKQTCLKLSSRILEYSDGSWVHRCVTKDLRNIQVYLASGTRPIKVMQVGVGNSSLFSEIRHRVTKFVGITIVPEEVDYARAQFPNEIDIKYEVQLANKYSTSLTCFGNNFDFIVDNDLSSYACCKHHFHEMLSAYRKILATSGVILVGKNGLGYFDSGFGLTEGLARKIFAKHGFALYKKKAYYELKLV